MKIAPLVAIMAVFLLPSANVLADGQQVAPEKRVEIAKLLETTGALQLGQQFFVAMVKQMTETLRAAHSNIPQKALDILPERSGP